MRSLILPAVALVGMVTMDGHVRANGYGDVQASAQATVVSPQAAPVYSAPQVQQQVIERQVTIPAQYEDVIEQRVVRQQVAPARTIIQRDVVQSYAPARSFATGCNVGAQAAIGYSTGAFASAPLRQNVIVQRAPRGGLRLPRLFGGRAGRVKTKAKTVVN